MNKQSIPKIPNIRQLPSGLYFCQIRMNGKSISISDEDYNKVYARAVATKAGILDVQRHPERITLGQAVDEYISAREGVLSPTTIRSYDVTRRLHFGNIMDKQICQITQTQLQREVSEMSQTLSPKSVRNHYILSSSVLKEHGVSYDIRLPQKQKFDYAIPTIEDMQKIISAAKGKKIELPVMLAIMLGLRVSEIRGLRYSDITDGIVHIKRANVKVGKQYYVKTTKTTAGDRYLCVPEKILSLIPSDRQPDDYIVTMTQPAISYHFKKLCEGLNLSAHYRFHDLRHANASIMLALGIPNKYAQERMGHATDNMLKSVYQHTMTKRSDEYSNILNKFFANELLTNN